MAAGCILNTAENRLKIREMTYYRDVSKIKIWNGTSICVASWSIVHQITFKLFVWIIHVEKLISTVKFSLWWLIRILTFAIVAFHVFFKYKDPFLSLIVGTVGQAVYIYSKWRNLNYKKRKASQKMETFASIYEWDIRILAQ